MLSEVKSGRQCRTNRALCPNGCYDFLADLLSGRNDAPTNKWNPTWPTPRPTVSRPIRTAAHYDAEALERDVGVRFKGVEKTNVAEYCVSESWIRVEAGKTKDRYGNPLTIKLTGPVEVYFRDGKKA